MSTTTTTSVSNLIEIQIWQKCRLWFFSWQQESILHTDVISGCFTSQISTPRVLPFQKYSKLGLMEETMHQYSISASVMLLSNIFLCN